MHTHETHKHTHTRVSTSSFFLLEGERIVDQRHRPAGNPSSPEIPDAAAARRKAHVRAFFIIIFFWKPLRLLSFGALLVVCACTLVCACGCARARARAPYAYECN